MTDQPKVATCPKCQGPAKVLYRIDALMGDYQKKKAPATYFVECPQCGVLRWKPKPRDH